MVVDDSAGHRRRLREKFLKSGLAGFHDYEIIELLLTLGSPRKDCKQPAKEALKKFHTLQGVLDAPDAQLQEIRDIGPHNAFGIKLVRDISREYLKGKIVGKPVYQSAQDVFDYLYHSMKGLKKEVFKIIYLNSQNQILEIEDLFQGTVDGSFVAPREVVEGAISHNATALIFVHNHPSGNPEPSDNDRNVTRDLVLAASSVQIRVLDHIVIGDGCYYSFAGEGLIEEYRTDYTRFRMDASRRTRWTDKRRGPKKS
jgi:DNA repair protein RadC